MINSQKRILVARFMLPLLVICSVFFPMRRAEAILPAVILADAIVEQLIIRSVARQVISTVSTAANDASWVSTFTSFLNSARSIGSLVISAANNKQYEIQIETTAVGDMTHAVTAIGFQYFYPMVALYSATNFQIGSPTFSNTSADVVASQYVAWWNANAKAEYQITSVDACYVSGYDSYCGAFAGVNYLFDIQPVGVDVETADGIKRIIGGVNGWSADPADPDWTAAEIAALQNYPALRFQEGVNGVIDLSRDSAGGLSVRFQAVSGANTVRVLGVDTDGNLVPLTMLSSNSAGAIADPASSSSAPSGSGSVVFPTDYNRESTQQSIDRSSALTSTNTAAIKDILTSTAADSGVVVPLDSDMPTFGNTFSDLLGWHVPAHSSTCPQPQLDLSGYLGEGKVYVMNSHCQLVQDNAAIIQASMMLVFSIMALFIVLRA